MKNILWMCIVCMALVNTITAQSIKVTAVAEKAFQQKFPDAKDVKWEKENSGEYEATFVENGEKKSANFSVNGQWLETEREIASFNAPKEIIQEFGKKYPGATIKEIYSIERKDKKNYYEIEYTLKGKKKEAKLYY